MFFAHNDSNLFIRVNVMIFFSRRSILYEEIRNYVSLHFHVDIQNLIDGFEYPLILPFLNNPTNLPQQNCFHLHTQSRLSLHTTKRLYMPLAHHRKQFLPTIVL